MAIIEIGILNAENGKILIRKELEHNLLEESEDEFLERCIETMRKVADWFNRQDTFYSKNIWDYWEEVGITQKFKAIVNGSRFTDVATESVIVFPKNGGRGIEYEFYVKRIERR